MRRTAPGSIDDPVEPAGQKDGNIIGSCGFVTRHCGVEPVRGNPLKLSRFIARSSIPAPAPSLYDWHARPGALERLTPPWDRVEVLERRGGIEDGGRVSLRVKAGPFGRRWEAVHRDHEPGRGFRDEQQSGPFAHWSHLHRFEPDGAERSLLRDEIEYALPLGVLGRIVGGGWTRRKLERLFTHRHAVTAADLARQRRYAEAPRLTVAIAGAGGLVGSSFVPFLTTAGHAVRRLVRRPPRGPHEIHWDPAAGRLDGAALEGVDALVNLAGENIGAGRWTADRKRRIVDSRVDGTRLLAETLAALRDPPRVLVNASAVGFYGDRGEEELDEASRPGDGFLAELCRDWEAATEPAAAAGIRVVLLRTGIVLTPAGGALAKMLPPFRIGLGGRVGSGRQLMSWISIEDLVGVLHAALREPRLSGPVNAVAPEPVTNRAFTRTLARVLRRPAVFPVPAAVVGLAFGEMGRELLLAGARVVPRRLQEAGFSFLHPELEAALSFVLGRPDPARGGARFEHASVP